MRPGGDTKGEMQKASDPRRPHSDKILEILCGKT